MQDKDRLGQFRYINYPELVSVIPNSDFINPRPDRRHGLPVVSFITVLHPANLRASLFPSCFWEISKVIEGRSQKFNRLFARLFS